MSRGKRELFLKLIRKLVHKIYLYKKQDHLGNRNKMRRATEKTEANTADYRIPGFSISTVKLQDAWRQK